MEDDGMKHLKKSKIITCILTAVLLCFFMTACGKEDTLEKLMSSDSARDKISGVRESILSQNSDIYSDYSMTVSGNDITYNYYYLPEFSDETLDKIQDSLKETDWSSTINSVKDEIEQTSSIRPASVTFAYYSADKKELFSIKE